MTQTGRRHVLVPRDSAGEGNLDACLVELISGAPWGGTPDDAEFTRLALEVFRAQASAIPAYGAYARHLGTDPNRISDWREIPPVPASAFKSHDLGAAPPGQEIAIFETSGTTISKPGRVRLGSTRLYEASLERNFRRHLVPDGTRLPTIVFGPTRAEAPRSSLWFMVDHVVDSIATEAVWIVRGGIPDWGQADDVLGRAAADGEPVILLGTTLLYMAYFLRLSAQKLRFPLPPGSRAMDTGGAKGQRAEFSRTEVEAEFARHLDLPRARIVNQYGMAEMASQFYDDVLLAHHEGRAPLTGKRIPPWVRTRVLNPETMEEQPEGERGVLVHFDLANREIPLAIQTEDVGARTGDVLRLEGRLQGAEARGCSLAFEHFLHNGWPGGHPETR